jgi:hypothetical protein
MLFRETVTVYCENHTEQTDTLCEQNEEFQCVKAGGTGNGKFTILRILEPLK